MNEVTREKLSSVFKALIDGVQELLKTTSSRTSEGVADLHQRLWKKLEEGKKALSERERALRATAAEGRASVEAYLHEKTLDHRGDCCRVSVWCSDRYCAP